MLPPPGASSRAGAGVPIDAPRIHPDANPCLPTKTNPGVSRAKENEAVRWGQTGDVSRGRLHDDMSCKMTLGNGYLGSCIDEERSEMRYLV